MAIQFSCASCSHPIEVDDDWANQQVSCPFCNKVVTAPASTTWKAESVMTARGVAGEEGFRRSAEPGMHGAEGAATAAATVRPLRRWAFILTMTGWVFLGVVVFIQMQKMLPMMQKVANDAGATPAEQQEAMQKAMKQMQEQMMGNPSLMLGLTLGQGLAFLCLVGGVVLAIVSIRRGERPMTLQVVTIVLSTLPVLCLCLGAMMMMGMAGAGG